MNEEIRLDEGMKRKPLTKEYTENGQDRKEKKRQKK